MLIDEIQKEVEANANNLNDEVLRRFLHLKDPVKCQKATALYHYVSIKLKIHHIKKLADDGFASEHMLLALPSLQIQKSDKRSIYYGTKCTCGKCNSRHDKLYSDGDFWSLDIIS